MVVTSADVSYPVSDGAPMGETEAHAEALWELVLVLRTRTDPARQHVAGNQFFYYVEGKPRKVFCPDVYVVGGVPQLPQRNLWKLWEEPNARLELVIELASADSRRRDVGPKRDLYERLGVQEYVVFDVLDEGLEPRLQMWRRQGEVLVPVHEPISAVARASLRPEGSRLRLVDLDGRPVPSPLESAVIEAHRAATEAERADEAERRAATERQGRQQAETRLAAALAELERLRSGEGSR